MLYVYELHPELSRLNALNLCDGERYPKLSHERRLNELKDISELSLQQGNYYDAFRAYRELGNDEGVRKVGDMCLAEAKKGGNWSYNAIEAFKHLGDRKQWLESLIGYAKMINGSSSTINDFLWDYMGPKFSANMREFEGWAAAKGLGKPISFYTGQIANMANQIAGNYDIGIAIASDGLYPGYIFNMFGLPVKVAQAKRKGSGATFDWVDEVSDDDLRGKNVAVFDIDVVSGRTSRRVARELRRYNPTTMDLILVHGPRAKKSMLGTFVENIPAEFRQTLYPNRFDYSRFGEVEEIFNRRYAQAA